MSGSSQAHEDSDLKYTEAALRRAAERARELGRRTNTPVWVVREGRLVDLTEEDEKLAQGDGETL
jgi:hypothetical protein